MLFKITYISGSTEELRGPDWESIKATFAPSELKQVRKVQRVWNDPVGDENKALKNALVVQAEKIESLGHELLETTQTCDGLTDMLYDLRAENAQLHKTAQEQEDEANQATDGLLAQVRHLEGENAELRKTLELVRGGVL